jgi:hypothetical protein
LGSTWTPSDVPTSVPMIDRTPAASYAAVTTRLPLIFADRRDLRLKGKTRPRA